ncbi:hypothetical protein [Capnocytophaga canis]|uniref:hypothetical protein n=1 Tax=Capnocytophaga canis TaxID=1848903 RepID=UPI00385A8D53
MKVKAEIKKEVNRVTKIERVGNLLIGKIDKTFFPKNEIKMNHLSRIVFILIFNLAFIACTKESKSTEEQSSFSDVELLKTDIRFFELIKSNINALDNIVDFNKAKSLI